MCMCAHTSLYLYPAGHGVICVHETLHCSVIMLYKNKTATTSLRVKTQCIVYETG